MKKILLLSLLFIQPSFAEMMCEDATDYYAIYEPYSYTCNNGEFLPANTLGCVSCPMVGRVVVEHIILTQIYIKVPN